MDSSFSNSYDQEDPVKTASVNLIRLDEDEIVFPLFGHCVHTPLRPNDKAKNY
jgi:hypothetical protein